MSETNEKKPPVGGDVVGQIVIDLLSNGVRVSSTLRGHPDSGPATFKDREVSLEVPILIGGLRERDAMRWLHADAARVARDRLIAELGVSMAG